MHIKVKEIEKPSIEVSIDGKKFKLTKVEAEQLLVGLEAALHKPQQLFPQVIYIDRWSGYPPSYPSPGYPTWIPIITCGPTVNYSCQQISNAS